MIAQNDIALICANKELAFRVQPAMTSVLTRDMLLFLRQLMLESLQIIIILQLIELVGLWACNQDIARIDIAETDLSTKNMARSLMQGLLRNHSHLVPLPNVEVLRGNIGEGHQHFFILRTKRTTNELFSFLLKL